MQFLRSASTITAVPERVADFGIFAFTQIAHQRLKDNLRIVLRDALHHRFFLRFRHGARFHLRQQRQQNDVTSCISFATP